MQTILRGLRLMSMVVWVGGIIFFVNVAQIAFSSLPTTHLAGIIVRGSLDRLHIMGYIAAVVFLLSSVAQIWKRRREQHLVRSYELSIAFMLVMLVCTAYSGMVVIPRMEVDRQAALRVAPEIDSLSKNDPIYVDFDQLHHESTAIEGVVLLFGVGVLALIAREPHLTAQR
jgi:nitrate reductase gamma subunit